MKPLKELQTLALQRQAEWDFEKFIKHATDDEIQTCAVYELARLSPTIREQMGQYRAAVSAAEKHNDDVEEENRGSPEVPLLKDIQVSALVTKKAASLLAMVGMAWRAVIETPHFPDTPWQELPKEAKRVQRRARPGHAAKILGIEHAQGCLFDLGAFGRKEFILSVDMTAKRADIEEAVNKELRAVLDGVGKQSKRGGTSAKEHLKAIAAFRLIVMEAKPWHREAWPGYCDQAAWMKAAAKVMKYLHEVFTLPSEEKPVR